MDQDALERAKFAMEEFKVLHAEILQRNTILMQIVAGGMAAIVAIIGFRASGNLSTCAMAGLLALVLAFIGAAWRFVHVDAVKASERIGEIEEYVNRNAGGDENNPLSWERRKGLKARGYFSRISGA